VRSLGSRFLPDPGPQRTIAAATLVNTIGNGVYLTAGVLYFTRVLRLPASEVGLGLSVAGAVALLAGVPGGHLADRLWPRGMYVWTLLVSAIAMAGLSVAGSFWSFLALASLGGAAQNSSLAARGPIIRHFGGARPQRFRAYVRVISNVGVSVGAVLAGWAIQVDTPAAYRMLIIGDAVSFLLCAVIVLRTPPMRTEPVAGGRHWISLRDRPYMALTALEGVLAIQFRVLSIAVPLWLVAYTSAPRWLISGAVVLNTLIVVSCQVPASAGVNTARIGGQALRRSGFAFLVSCVVISLTAGVSSWLAVTLVLVAVAVHSMGELWHAAGGFEVSFGLAPPHAQGQYLGMFGMGMGLAELIAPALLTALCIGWGRPGWYVMGAVFAASGLAAPSAVRWAVRSR